VRDTLADRERHQTDDCRRAATTIATVLDFLVLIALVSGLGLPLRIARLPALSLGIAGAVHRQKVARVSRSVA